MRLSIVYKVVYTPHNEKNAMYSTCIRHGGVRNYAIRYRRLCIARPSPSLPDSKLIVFRNTGGAHDFIKAMGRNMKQRCKILVCLAKNTVKPKGDVINTIMTKSNTRLYWRYFNYAPILGRSRYKFEDIFGASTKQWKRHTLFCDSLIPLMEVKV